MTEYLPIELAALRVQAETGLSARELAEMSLDEYARATGRKTIGEIASEAFAGPQPPAVMGDPTAQPPTAPAQEPAAGPPGIDLAGLSMRGYAALRGQLGVTGPGDAGIFGASGSQSRAYADAARAQSGRTSSSTRNVIAPPRIGRAYARQDDMRDTRSKERRFGLPGNATQF